MTEPVTGAHGADDASLLNRVRAGDSAAFAHLYQRHHAAARRLARELVRTPAEIDDAVAETFARMLEVTRRGGGPTDAFRPYMLTVLRRVCYDRLRGQRTQVPTDVRQMPDPGEAFADPAVAELDSYLIMRAFLSLPERWRAVLWHTEIEQEGPVEVGPVLGLSRNGVSALRRRALQGLRQAYLQMHIARVNRQACKPVAERLGAFVRDELSRRDTSMVTEHLRSCADCRTACAELTDINAALRGVVAPIFLGAAAASYLSGAGHSASAGSAAATGARHASGAAGHGAAAGANLVPAAGHGAAGGRAGVAASPFTALSRIRQGSRPYRWLAAGLAVVVAAIGVGAWAITLDASSSPRPPDRNHAVAVPPDAVKSSVPGSTSSPRASARPTPSLTPSPRHTVTTSPSAKPPPSPSPPASAPFTLTAAISVYGGWHGGGQVSFRVTDTGSNGTGPLIASITLPAGSSMSAGSGGGWFCRADSTGATCQHAAISPRQQAQGGILISVSGPHSAACGQPVKIAVTSDSVSTSARSPQDIQCNSSNH